MYQLQTSRHQKKKIWIIAQMRIFKTKIKVDIIKNECCLFLCFSRLVICGVSLSRKWNNYTGPLNLPLSTDYQLAHPANEYCLAGTKTCLSVYYFRVKFILGIYFGCCFFFAWNHLMTSLAPKARIGKRRDVPKRTAVFFGFCPNEGGWPCPIFVTFS